VNLFRYMAKDGAGRDVVANMEAENERAVVTALRKRGLVVLSVSEEAGSSSGPRKSRRKVKPSELVVFSRQLATMVDAGLPLVQALDTLAEQTEHPSLKAVLQDVVSSIEQGSGFSEAMSAHPRVFSSLFINMVRAGEASGTLAEILDRIAAYLESAIALKRKVRSAMIYPAIVSSMAVIITTILLLKVIPVFRKIYESFGSALPTPTQMLLNFSDFLRAYFPFAVGGLVVGIIVLKKYVKTDSGRMRFDKVKVNIPIFGPIFRKVAVSRFSRTLSVLVKSGVPILSALEIVSKKAGNKLVERAVDQAMEEIKRGENIARPLAASDVFPPMVTKMIAVGEESGKLEIMLSKIADFYDSQVDAAVSGLTSLIEPLLIAFLGVVVGGIVICMFLPIFRLSTIVQM
jgi:type IV pilus assembly protein PilC